MKHCYFCNTSSSQVEGNYGLPRIKCEYCSTHTLDVYTYFLEKLPIYVDIILRNKEKEFFFTLYLKDNLTTISFSESFSEAITLPGFPVNPLNAQQKLKLYLLFS